MTKYNKMRKKQVKTISNNIKLQYNDYVNGLYTFNGGIE